MPQPGWAIFKEQGEVQTAEPGAYGDSPRQGFDISPHGLLENCWVPDPKVPTARLDWKIMPAMSSGVQEGSSFPLAWAFVRRVVSVARPSIDPHV